MPKRLSDITHVYERTSADLERSQDDLTRATESARSKVDACAQARHRAYDDLYRWLKDHPDIIVVAGDYGYRYERGQIARMKIVWAHHTWVDDPTPAPSYHVPPVESFIAAEWNMAEPRAGEAESDTAMDNVRATWEDAEPTTHPVTICPD